MSSTPVTPQTNSSSKVTVSTSREVALEQELSQIIEKVNGDLNQINNGATNTMILMNKWTDIMSQADFTLDVINNSGWIPNDEYDNEFGEGQRQQQDDNEDEEEIEAKLRALEQENLEISKKIENQAKEKNAKMNRAREIDSKRKRELGLFNVRKKASR